MDEFFNELNKTVNKLAGRINFQSLLKQKLVEQDNFMLCCYLEELSAFDSNLERMKYVYRDLVRFEIYPPFQKDEKCDQLAVTKRQEGNVHYGLGKYREALDCYTSSILVAKNSRVAALAYANRSAALSKLGLHGECLTEIDRALKEDYPEDLKPKLLARQMHSKAQKISHEKQYEPVPEIPESEKHPQIACARNCVKIRKNQKYGRLVEATRNIQIGEVLAVDSAYAGVIHDDELFYIYCHECFELCYNLIPCDKCTKALYCSVTCKDSAFNTYHKYECPILLSLDSLQLDDPKKLALRIVLKAKNELDTHSDDLDGIYRSDRFKEVSNLPTHVEKRSGQDIFAKTAMSCGLFDLIKKHTTFLEDGASEDGLMEALLSVSFICGTSTVGLNELSPKMGEYDHNAIVTAVYSFFNLFNHSCFPNVSRHYHGSKMVIRAISTIKKGEQCFVEYGPNYLFYDKEFRQNFLRNCQFFTCTCPACKEDWPMRPGLPKRVDWLVDESLTLMKLRTADVTAAKKELARLLEKAKKAEKSVPPGHDYVYRHMLLFCYDIFGNKRRF